MHFIVHSDIFFVDIVGKNVLIFICDVDSQPTIRMHTYIDASTRSATVIVMWNWMGDTTSKSGRRCLLFTLCKCPGERCEPFCFLFINGWILGKTGFFSFDKATSLGEWELWIETSFKVPFLTEVERLDNCIHPKALCAFSFFFFLLFFVLYFVFIYLFFLKLMSIHVCILWFKKSDFHHCFREKVINSYFFKSVNVFLFWRVVRDNLLQISHLAY